ncbi:MAG TPA: hypothetical protein VG984_00010 [Candidatus Paceibacterota bacterium]|nr:hypothetical protein [Candidatus Paceibacterota bacterium]
MFDIASFSSVQEFWDSILASPFHYVEIVFAFLATIAFLIFLRGFLGSIGNVFKMNGHDEHVAHAQVRQVWGLFLLAMVFAVWEMTRTVASWIGFHDGGQTNLGYYIAALIALVGAYRFVKKNLFSGGGGGH